MLINQTRIDQKAMVALAKISRKTIRRGRSSPVRTFACCVAAVELGLAALFLRAGAGGWLTNLLMAAIMLTCVLAEDTVNGILTLRQIIPAAREVNATFQEEGYIHRTQAGESWWPYRQVRAIGEDEHYFALITDKTHGHIYDKEGFDWGTPDEFRDFIQRKTGLKIQKVK